MTKAQLQSIVQNNPTAILHAILEAPFWPPTIKTGQVYSRLHDDNDGRDIGRINVTFSEDGDAWVSTDLHDMLRFRTTFFGGGRSPCTRTALLILAEAIRLDNLGRPIQLPEPNAKR